jgi:hypothetical protein
MGSLECALNVPFTRVTIHPPQDKRIHTTQPQKKDISAKQGVKKSKNSHNFMK